MMKPGQDRFRHVRGESHVDRHRQSLSTSQAPETSEPDVMTNLGSLSRALRDQGHCLVPDQGAHVHGDLTKMFALQPLVPPAPVTGPHLQNSQARRTSWMRQGMTTRMQLRTAGGPRLLTPWRERPWRMLGTKHRRQLRELCPDQSSRSLASRVGALRRRLSQSCCTAIQGLSTQRLEGTLLREWSNYEFQVTRTYRPGRGPAEPVD